MSEEQQEQQEEQQPQAESNMQKLAGEDLNAPTEEENSHLQTDAEPEGVDPDEIEFVKPEFLPEKFWDPENGTNVEKLSKAYSELEKKFSRGEHKAPKEYDTSFLGENVPEDDEMLNSYLDKAKRYGMSQEDFQELAMQFVGAVRMRLRVSKSLSKSKRKCWVIMLSSLSGQTTTGLMVCSARVSLHKQSLMCWIKWVERQTVPGYSERYATYPAPKSYPFLLLPGRERPKKSWLSM